MYRLNCVPIEDKPYLGHMDKLWGVYFSNEGEENLLPIRELHPVINELHMGNRKLP